ncbi:MAG: Transcriptional regulator, XRE family [Parcubacteria group bacterium GW2011_GWA2_38_13]|nr:MAG: Transcriptional regulator, XRE family [Parcubacteria group bacterium GW2011_GWA2_38_13]
MVSFRKKRIKTENAVNEILRAARNTSGILISEVSHALRISQDYLVLLEAGLYPKLPGEVYVKNFIKAYANYLHLNSGELLDFYKREKDVYKNIQPAENSRMMSPVKFLSRFYFFSIPKLIKIASVSCVVFIAMLYLGFKVEAIIRPPELFVTTPASDILVDGKYIEVQGITEEESVVTINGQDVLVNTDGSFSERINLSNGINEIVVTARKNHSKENTILRKVVVREKE